jgi:hypothetical protein
MTKRALQANRSERSGGIEEAGNANDSIQLQ